MNCPHCKSVYFIKSGFVKQLQRYKCKKCLHQFTLERTDAIDPILLRLSFHLYLEGIGYRKIGRLLNIPHNSLYYHLSQFSNKLIKINNQNTLVVNAGHIQNYMLQKLAISKNYKFLLIDCETGISLFNT